MQFDPDKAKPKQIQILKEAFARLTAQRNAVSTPHRADIARRLIIAARDGVTSVKTLVDRVNAS